MNITHLGNICQRQNNQVQINGDLINNPKNDSYGSKGGALLSSKSVAKVPGALSLIISGLQRQATYMAKTLGERTVRLISFSMHLCIQVPKTCYSLCKPVLQAIPQLCNKVATHLAAPVFTGAYKQYSDTDIHRFRHAQDYGTDGSTYAQAFQELKDGKKTSHWSWYVFPIVIGLGSSEKNHYFSIKSMDEAKQYWNDPTLRQRLVESFEALRPHYGRDLYDILGKDDVWKLHACATLFGLISGDPNSVFQKTLKQFFNSRLHTDTEIRYLQWLGTP